MGESTEYGKFKRFNDMRGEDLRRMKARWERQKSPVLIDDRYAFDSVGTAAKYLGCTGPTVSKYIRAKKEFNGHKLSRLTRKEFESIRENNGNDA